jgi:hypothetical protein
MDEPALSFQGVTLSPQKELARIFHKEMWHHADKSLIPAIFHSDFTFRGSLGSSLIGHDIPERLFFATLGTVAGRSH